MQRIVGCPLTPPCSPLAGTSRGIFIDREIDGQIAIGPALFDVLSRRHCSAQVDAVSPGPHLHPAPGVRRGESR